jgi:hypothetical protein
MVYNTKNYWVFGLFQSSGILENREHDVLETICFRPQVSREHDVLETICFRPQVRKEDSLEPLRKS